MPQKVTCAFSQKRRNRCNLRTSRRSHRQRTCRSSGGSYSHPGTLTDDALLNSHQSSNLVALCLQQNQIGIALLDLSAGIFKVQQQDFKLEQLSIELARLMPSEILVDEDMLIRIF